MMDEDYAIGSWEQRLALSTDREGQLRRQRIQSFYKRAFNLSVGGLDLDAARRAGGDSGEEGCGRSE